MIEAEGRFLRLHWIEVRIDEEVVGLVRDVPAVEALDQASRTAGFP